MLACRPWIRLALVIAAVLALSPAARAHACQQPQDSLIAADNFTRANETPLAGHWTATELNLSSNHVEPAGLSADGEAFYSGATWPNDQYSKAKLTVTGTGGGDQGVGLLVRRSATARTHYRLAVDHATSDNVGLSRMLAGTYTNLITFTQSWSDGDVWELRVTGTKLQIFRNGTQVGTDVIESSITSGSAGIAYSSTESAAAIDDWEGGRAGTPSDNFTRANETPLSGPWTATGFNLSSNHVVPASLGTDGSAYYSRITTWPDNQYSKAKLSVTGTAGGGQGVGLLVRRSASATTHYRLIVDHAASNNVSLKKAIAGSYTTLATFTQSWSDGDVWELRVTNTKLQIYRNGTQVGTDTTDSAIAAGSPGLAYANTETAASIDDWEGGYVAPAGPAWPHQPAGFTAFKNTDFTTFPTDGWGTAGATIVTDLSAPVSPTHQVIQWQFDSTLDGGSSPGAIFNNDFLGSVDEYFVGYYFKFSNPYSNGVNGTGMWFPFGTTGSYTVVFNDDSTIFFGVQTPDSVYNLDANISNPKVTLGVWHQFEHYFKPATSPTAHDGIIRWWIDGVLCGDYSDRLWPSPDQNWEEWRYYPTWFDDESNHPAFTSYQWVDQIYLSHGPMGPNEPVATAIDRTVATTLAASTAFLYTGENPVQTGVDSGTIDPVRVAVLRGRVIDRNGTPLPGVAVTVLDHPEFGQTLSRANGDYDLAANGGGTLTLTYALNGYLAAHRMVATARQDYAPVFDVVLVPIDTAVATIAFTQPIEVARGTAQTDTNGMRQATLLFRQGTTAMMVLPDTTLSIDTLHVRATEYTVGPHGAQAMPAPLPPTVAYTYAVELSADEAVEAGATSVEFSLPVAFYVENFLGFPVGVPVPLGSYDRARAVWVPEDNGRVIKILSTTGDTATIDADGDSLPDDSTQLAALGVTVAERVALAGLYAPGQTLWRVQTTHFTTIDANYAFKQCPTPSTCPPRPPKPPTLPAQPKTNSCQTRGSIVECENQTLGETIPIVGTGFSLNYRSDRVRGRKTAYRIDIPVTGSSFASGVDAVWVSKFVAGRTFLDSAEATTNLSMPFTWDGRDAYGRLVQGEQPVFVTIWYRLRPPSCGWGRPGTEGRSWGRYATDDEMDCAGIGGTDYWVQTGWSHGEWESRLGLFDSQALGLGGWALSVHHVYDPIGRTLYLGTGERRWVGSQTVAAQDSRVVAGNGAQDYTGDGGPATEASVKSATALALAPDGTLYILDGAAHVVRRVGVDGVIETVAGTGTPGFSGDSGPAIAAELHDPADIALAADGSLYIADRGNFRVRRVGLDGTITTVAGTGDSVPSGDGGLAAAADLAGPVALATGLDGGLYVGDGRAIRQLTTDGFITTVAGNDTSAGCESDSIPAANACFSSDIAHLAVGPDARLYILERGNPHTGAGRLRQVNTDGMIKTVAGASDGDCLFAPGNGGPATAAGICPTTFGFAADGSILIADGGDRLRAFRVGGPIGEYWHGPCSNTGGPELPRGGQPLLFGSRAPSGFLSDSVFTDCLHSLVVGPHDALYVGDETASRVRLREVPLPGFIDQELQIAAADGSEVYEFDPQGRHLSTRDALTGTARWTFGYDTLGTLVSVTDVDSNVTAIERDSTGAPTGIVGPFGQRTTLALDSAGYLASVSNPAGFATTLKYATGGLLDTLVDARGFVHQFTYDSLGLLVMDADPAGGSLILARTTSDSGYEVTDTTALGRVKRYREDTLAAGGRQSVFQGPDTLRTVTTTAPDGTTTTIAPDSTTTTTTFAPDPRFGMQAPVLDSLTVRLPSGAHATLKQMRHDSLSNPADPLSLVSQTDSVGLNGNVSVNSYTAPTRHFVRTSPEGRQLFSTLDPKGRTVSGRVADLDSVTFSYDTLGRLVQQQQVGRITSYAYHPANGRLASVTDPLGRITRFDYDSAGRVIRQTQPDSSAIQFTYDSAGNLTSLTPPGRPAHTFRYTSVDLTERYDPPGIPDSTPTRYFYNVERQLDSLVRPDSVTVTFSYDSAGRPSAVTFDRGTLTYGYSGITGRLIAIRAPNGDSLTFGYDGSLPSQARWAGTVNGSVQVVHDNNFRVTAQTVNASDEVDFSYDRDGVLTGAGSLALGRSATSDLLLTDTLGPVRSSYRYTSRGELEGYRVQYDTATIVATGYGRDSLGRIVQLFDTTQGTARHWRFVYDSLGRLVKDSVNGAIFHAFAYDSNGNRLSVTSGAGTITYTYDNQDRLLRAVHSLDTTVYTYGSNGELRTKSVPGVGTTTYTYDALGNLVTVVLPDSTVIDYLVDGQNRRVGRKVNGVLTQCWLYQNQLNVVAELDSSGNVVSRFVYGTRPNVPDYMIKDSTVYRLVSDHLGSVRLVVDTATGTVAQRLDYDEWGDVTLNTNPGFQPFGFVGGVHDHQTGLTRFGARDYDPTVGRWTARDPSLFGTGGANLYAYALADPVDVVDANGNIPLPLITGAIGAVFSFGGNAIVQVYVHGGVTCFSWRDALVAGGVGFVAGAVAPYVAVTRVGAAILGGVANTAQYAITQGLSDQPLTTGGVLVAAGTGVVGGLFGGPIQRVPEPYDASTYSLLNRYGDAAQQLNDAAQIQANTAASNLARNGAGSIVSSVQAPNKNCGCK